MQPNSRLRRAAIAVAVLWFVNGLTTATIGARLPSILDKAHLDEGTLGLALAGQAIALIAAMFVAQWLVRWMGARPVAVIFGVLYCASTALPGHQTELRLLFLAFLAVGAFNAPLDITMAHLGGALEVARERAMMSSFEALFVVGQILGALVGLVCTALYPVEVGIHLTVVAAVAVAMVVVASFALPKGNREPRRDEHGRGAPLVLTRRTFALAFIAFASLWCEGAVVDWSALLFRDELGAGELAPLGLACFVTAVLVALLLGNRLADGLGAAPVTAIGGVLFAGGMVVTLLAPSIWMACAGLALAGIGFPNAHPYALSAAHRLGGARVLAFVQAMSYVGLVVAKPVIGWLADAGSLRQALGTTVAFALLSALFAGALRNPRRNAAPWA